MKKKLLSLASSVGQYDMSKFNFGTILLPANRIKVMSLFLLICSATLILSCDTDDDGDSPLCIQGPAGTIQQNQINISTLVLIPDVTAVILVFENSEEISLDGVSPDTSQNYTNWQTIPSNDITLVKLQIGDELLELLPGSIPETEQLALYFNRSNDIIEASFVVYEEGVCNDTPNG